MQAPGVFMTLLTLLRTLWGLLKSSIRFLATFSGGLGQQIILILAVSFLLPLVLDKIEKYLFPGFVWLLNIFK